VTKKIIILLTNSPAHQLISSPVRHLLALGIEVESPERGTSEDLERKARPVWERQNK